MRPLDGLSAGLRDAGQEKADQFPLDDTIDDCRLHLNFQLGYEEGSWKDVRTRHAQISERQSLVQVGMYDEAVLET